MATTAGAEEVPEPVVITNPVMAQQIRALFMCYSLGVIALFAYAAYLQFSVDGPSWEAFACTAGLAPFFIIPLCFVPWLRDVFITIYAQGPPDSTSTGGDLSSNLLGPENA